MELRGIAVAIDLDRSSCAFDLGEIGSGQLGGGCADTLLQAMVLRGAGDREDPWALRQQPGERELSRGGVLSRAIHFSRSTSAWLFCIAWGVKRDRSFRKSPLRNLGFPMTWRWLLLHSSNSPVGQ
jgi:hypothetical protein